MKNQHDVRELRFEGGNLCVTVDGRERKYPIGDISSSLERATDRERNTYEISPSGYGIHWPLLDEDLSIDALLSVTHQPQATERRT